MTKSFLHSLCLLIAICLAAFCASVTAHAQFAFTSAGAFENQLQSGFYLENFDNVSAGTHNSPIAFSGGTPAFSYQIASETGPSGLFVGTTSTRWVSTFNGNETMTITFNSGNVTAVGANFYLTDFTAAAIAGSVNLSVTTTGPTGGVNNSPVITSVASGTEPFLGFTAADGDFITSLTVAASGANTFNTLDNLYVGIAVPEPSQWGFCFGVLGLAFAGVRRWRFARV